MNKNELDLNAIVGLLADTPVTRGALIVADLRDQMRSILRHVSLDKFVALRAAESKATTRAAQIANLCLLAEWLTPVGGEQERSDARALRHTLTDLLQHAAPSDHAEYRTIKYPHSTDPAILDAARVNATSWAMQRLAERFYVEGL